jgi:hypothetical protein
MSHPASASKYAINRYAGAAIAGLMFLVGAALIFEGRRWWCPAGDPYPWSWQVWSQHNSQHLLDPYSFTHLLHGVLEFWFISLLFPRVPLGWRLVIGLSVEGAWEVLENTEYVINRYREATISLNYYGDSILNSLADVTFCGVGFLTAYLLRFWRSALLFAVTEAILLITIHDSLILNIIMLIYPMESLRLWQQGH